MILSVVSAQSPSWFQLPSLLEGRERSFTVGTKMSVECRSHKANKNLEYWRLLGSQDILLADWKRRKTWNKLDRLVERSLATQLWSFGTKKKVKPRWISYEGQPSEVEGQITMKNKLRRAQIWNRIPIGHYMARPNTMRLRAAALIARELLSPASRLWGKRRVMRRKIQGLEQIQRLGNDALREDRGKTLFLSPSLECLAKH